MKTYEYFTPGFSSIDEVIAHYGKPLDATTLQKCADCPRKHEILVLKNLTKPDPSPKMVAGIALHAGLEFYYSHAERTRLIEEMAIEIVREEWRSFRVDRGTMDPKASHLSEELLTGVMENYFLHWNHSAIEIYTPISGLHLDDLYLGDLIAGKFILNERDEVVLGESNLIMKFNVDGEEFIYAGKPDLPTRQQDGTLCIMDHKSTSQYLSDWWAKSFEVSNKMRCYMGMVGSLLGEMPRRAVINGLHVGAQALNPKSKAAKFARFDYAFSEGHIKEALKNQLVWKKTIEFYESIDYFPQGCDFGGCSMPDLCRVDPEDRPYEEATKYVQNPRKFWDL